MASWVPWTKQKVTLPRDHPTHPGHHQDTRAEWWLQHMLDNGVEATTKTLPSSLWPLASHYVGEEEESEEGLLEAFRQDEKDDLQREQSDLQAALLLSKAEALSADGVALSRLTFHTPHVASLL